MMKNVMSLDAHRLVLPGVIPTDLDTILTRVQGLPVGLAYAGGGVCHFPTWTKRNGSLVPGPTVHAPLPSTNGRLRRQRVRIGTPQEHTWGTVLDLNGLLSKAHAMVEAHAQQRPRNASYFYKEYQTELWDNVAHTLEDQFLSSQWECGYQAQLDSDVRLLWDEIGVSPWVEKKLIKLIFETYGIETAAQALQVKETGDGKAVYTLDGLEILWTGYPAIGKYPARWCTLRILGDQKSTKIYGNGWAMQVLNGRDTDGDLSYFHIPGWLNYREAAALKTHPILRPVGDEPTVKLSDVFALVQPEEGAERRKAMLNQVMGALVKDLTGLLTHVYYLCCRSASDARRDLETGPREAHLAAGEIVFHATERVLDSRKDNGPGPEAVFRFAQALARMLNHEPWDEAMAAGWKPFLDPVDPLLVAQLERLYREGECLQRAFRTAGGALVAAGGKGRRFHAERVLGALRKRKLTPQQIREAIQQDLLLEESCPVPLPEERKAMNPELPQRSHVPVALENFQQVIERLRYAHPEHGVRRVFKLTAQSQGTPYPQLTLVATPYWKCKSASPAAYPAIVLQLPAITQETDFGHCRVRMPGGTIHFFRPTVRLALDGSVRVFDLYNELLHQLLGVMDQFYNDQLWSSHEKLELHLNKCVREWVNSLDRSDSHEAGARDWMGKCEVAIQSPEYKDSLKKWADLEIILTWLAEHGYDIAATSKGKAGTIAARGNNRGDAAYGNFLNPSYKWDNWGRRPELRGIRESLPLVNPTLPLFWFEGKHLPTQYQDRVSVDWWAVLDCNYNWFEAPEGHVEADANPSICFDTLLCTHRFRKGLAPREEVYEVDEDRLEEFLSKKRELGITEDQLTVEDYFAYLGQLPDGETHQDVCLAKKRIRIRDTGRSCEGKVKSLWGAPKGVMTMLPEFRGARPYFLHPQTGQKVYVNIVPAKTIRKKKQVSWIHNSQRLKAGLYELQASETLESSVAATQTALTAQRWDPEGVETLYVDVPSTKELDQEFGACRLEVGKAFVGAVPFYRAQETETSSARFLHQGKGMKIDVHTLVAIRDEEHPLTFPHRPEADRKFDLQLYALNRVERELEQLEQQPQTSGASAKAGASAVSGPCGYSDADAPPVSTR